MHTEEGIVFVQYSPTSLWQTSAFNQILWQQGKIHEIREEKSVSLLILGFPAGAL